MDDVKVLVRVFWCGQTRSEVVSVPVSAFPGKCWRVIAAMKAAALLGIPFTEVSGKAKYGLNPENISQLTEICGGRAEGKTDFSAAKLSESFRAVEMTEETAGAH